MSHVYYSPKNDEIVIVLNQGYIIDFADNIWDLSKVGIWSDLFGDLFYIGEL